jgi:hypothetical protein
MVFWHGKSATECEKRESRENGWKKDAMDLWRFSAKHHWRIGQQLAAKTGKAGLLAGAAWIQWLGLTVKTVHMERTLTCELH